MSEILTIMWAVKRARAERTGTLPCRQSSSSASRAVPCYLPAHQQHYAYSTNSIPTCTGSRSHNCQISAHAIPQFTPSRRYPKREQPWEEECKPFSCVARGLDPRQPSRVWGSVVLPLPHKWQSQASGGLPTVDWSYGHRTVPAQEAVP